MSYGPPPTKSPYGDTDFTYDDKWSTPGVPTQSFDPPTPTNQSWSVGPVDTQSTGIQPNIPQSVNPQQAQGLSSIAEAARSITPEDIIFTRTFQRDCFVNRVLPLNAVAIGCLFLYNKKNNLPNKFSRYFAVSMVSYFVGKWSFRGELKRRLVESPSNTPYMQALRKAFYLQPSQVDGNWAPSNQFNAVYTPPAIGGFEISEPSNSNVATNYQPVYDSENPTNTELPQQATSYDELRARNRGYIR